MLRRKAPDAPGDVGPHPRRIVAPAVHRLAQGIGGIGEDSLLPRRGLDPLEEPAEDAPAAGSAASESLAAPVPVPSANPVRLIGVVRKGGTVKAAVSMWGEKVVMAEGEESRGYKVLSIDDEGGVWLRGPDGSELTLPPSSF